jgi:hypothetical protein
MTVIGGGEEGRKTLPTANCLQSAMDNTRKKGNVRNDVAE